MRKVENEMKGRYQRKVFYSKSLALVLACILLIGGVVGGTVAWLTAQTSTVTNKFSTSDISVELKEHTYDADKDTLTSTETPDGVDNYKMIPGWTIPKDPWAKVTSGSEDCYLFIKVEETGGNVTVGTTTYTFNDFIEYAIADGWVTLDATNYPGVYYRVIDEDGEKGVAYNILGDGTYPNTPDTTDVEYTWADDQVLTKPEVTKEMMAAINENNKPTLKFTAYAVQLWKANESGGETAKFNTTEAWQKISN